MKRIEIEAIIQADVEKVFSVVTNNADYKWRSDVEKLVILDDKHFVEYYQKGGETQFTITKKRKNREYAFDMENNIFEGEWLGKFYPQENHQTKVIFTEFIEIRNPLLRIISTIMMNPKKLQKQYIKDLQAKVQE